MFLVRAASLKGKPETGRLAEVIVFRSRVSAFGSQVLVFRFGI